MLSLLKHASKWMLSVAAVGLIASCSDHSDIIPAPEEEQEQGIPCDCIVLHLYVGDEASTRAGDDGDGPEAAVNHENDIMNLCLYQYSGVNGDLSDLQNNDLIVRKLAHVPNVNFTPTDGSKSTTVTIRDIPSYMFKPGKDKFIVAANAGNITDDVTTLGELRDFIVEETCTYEAANPDIAHFSHFVMSNIDLSTDNSQDGSTALTGKDLEVSITLERLSARIDFCADPTLTFDATVGDTPAWKYTAKVGGDGDAVGSVYLTHVRTFNAMLNPSYLIKRLSESASGTKYYLQKEVTSAAAPTSLYVEEPTTWNKASEDDKHLESMFGSSRYAAARSNTAQWFRSIDGVRPFANSGNAFTTGTSEDAERDKYFVVTYTNENTVPREAITGSNTTGLMLKTYYAPSVVYNNANCAESDKVTYTVGNTFWRFRYEDDDTSVFFSTEAAANEFAATVHEAGTVIKYENGISYYPVMLRHYYRNGTPEFPYKPMQFGIVRNNIYRLKVSFSGPGYAELPDPTEITPGGITPYIYVLPWYVIDHPVIEL